MKIFVCDHCRPVIRVPIYTGIWSPPAGYEWRHITPDGTVSASVCEAGVYVHDVETGLNTVSKAYRESNA